MAKFANMLPKYAHTPWRHKKFCCYCMPLPDI